MTASTTNQFEESLVAHDVTSTRVTPAAFESALAEAIDEPAVGARLSYDGVSLEDTAVTLDPTPAQLQAAETGVTPVGVGIAEYGTTIIQSTERGEEPVSLYPHKHVAVVREDDIVPDVPTAIEWLSEEFSAGRSTAIFATGPSATGDMGALVQGVHGPGEVHVIILSESQS